MNQEREEGLVCDRIGCVKRVLVLSLFLLAACVHAPSRNQYGLEVISSPVQYARAIERDPVMRLVAVDQFVPGVVLDIHYATDENFMKRPLYPRAAAYLRFPAVLALRRVQEDLAPHGLGLKVWDSYRPYSVTEAMWEPYKDPDFVADPAKGSRHNRGAAVDVTLVNLETGEELEMPTPYDEFSLRAAANFSELPADVITNRERLRSAMERHGFKVLASEWWHYDFDGWKGFALMDLSFDEIENVWP